MNELKSGVKTSEFWLTLISVLISAAVSVGAITAPDGDVLNAAVMILCTALSTIFYNGTRVYLKTM